MCDIEVPYLPISDFDVFEISKEISDIKNDELNDDKIDFKSFKGNDYSEEVPLILLGMGMEKYTELFKKMNITLDSFLNINESELEDIGISDADDRRIIAKNLIVHKREDNDFIVSENHIEDLSIIKNISYQLTLVQNYCSYLDIQMRKQTLRDYAVDSEDSACTFLKAFAECALTQSQIMSHRIYDENDSDALTDKLLKTYNLTLSKLLQDTLPKKKRKRKYVLKLMIVIGFSSLVVLTGRYLVRRS